jgi:putative DNA primase/helicase
VASLPRSDATSAHDRTAVRVVSFPDTDRPLIRIEGGRLPEHVDAADRALAASGASIYSRGPVLVTPAVIETPASDGRSFKAPRLHLVSEVGLAEILTRTVRFERYDVRRKNWRPVDCPKPIALTLLARQKWSVPSLSGIIFAPTLNGRGDLIGSPGYDPLSQLYLWFEADQFPNLPAKPTRVEAEAALAILLEAIATFPFKGDVDRSVAISGLLTSLVRRSLKTAPLHAVTSHLPGSGKTLLVDVIATIATGNISAAAAVGKTAEELDKRLGGLLMRGNPVILLDNIDQPLTSDLLCQSLTQELVALRVLGKSDIVETPTGSTFFATGNNLQIAGDLTRRCLMAQLDPQSERPERETFARNALMYASERRGVLAAAALTVMRAYALAGWPTPLSPLGSFEEWSRLVREAIVWCGGADPVASQDHIRRDDPQRQELRAAMHAWAAVFRSEKVTVADVKRRSRGSSLHDALVQIAGRADDINTGSLGKWLSNKKGVRLDGAHFEAVGQRHGTVLWRLEDAEGLAGTVG